ncbi:hypothetical protein ACWJTY_23395, partial [Klebsiella pneumoniae]
KGSAILGCVGCLVGHLFMFLVGGKTPDQSVHLNLTTTHDYANAILRRKPPYSVVPPFISIYTKSFALHRAGSEATGRKPARQAAE